MFLVDEQSTALSGDAAARKLQALINFAGALDLIYDEATMIVRANQIGLGSGFVWLARSDRSDPPGEALRLITINAR